MVLNNVLATKAAVQPTIAEYGSLKALDEAIDALGAESHKKSYFHEEIGSGRDELVTGLGELRGRVAETVIADKLGINEGLANAIRQHFYLKLSCLAPYYTQVANANILAIKSTEASMRTCNITTVAMTLEGLGKTASDFQGNSTLMNHIVSRLSLGTRDANSLRLPDFLQILAIYLAMVQNQNASSLNALATSNPEKLMRPIIFFLLVLLLIKTTQGQLYISAGGQVRMLGNAQLTLKNMNLLNNGNFSPGSGLVSFTGNNSSGISGSQTTVFYDVEINKDNGREVIMQAPVDILNEVRFASGNLNLDGNILQLGTTGSLLGEKESSRIVGSNGGQVLYSTVLNGSNAANPANLGLIISTSQNLDTVLIRRGHQSQVNNYGTGNSVLRYYDIAPAHPVSFSASPCVSLISTGS